MNCKTRWLKTMRFEPVDRPPLMPGGPWNTTRKRWEQEGLPVGADLTEYFGLDSMPMRQLPFSDWFYPPFQEKVLEETDDWIVKINPRGVKVRNFKDEISMPEHLEYPIKGPQDLAWLKERFDFNTPGRVKPNWLEEARANQANTLHFINAGMYFAYLNEHMGTEQLMYAYTDCPEFIHQFNELQCKLTEDGLKAVLQHFPLDLLAYHEDMGYKTASLISPAMFREFMMPYYKRVTKIALAHGIDLGYMDSDGNIEELIPLWLECGINIFTPLEVAAGMDVVKIRKQYGQQVRITGGFDKRILAAGKAEIRQEVERLRPVIEGGGFIPGCDHGIPHDVPFANFRCFVDCLKVVYGMKT